MRIQRKDCRNLLLRSLGDEDFGLLAPDLSRVPLVLNKVLAAPGQPIDAVYFPETGIVSFSDVLNDGSCVGIGHAGYEGLSGWPVLLGADRSPHEARVTVDGGNAFRIASERLTAACRISDSLRDLMLRFVQAMLVQFGRTVVSNLTQPVEPRLCRWTLMAHDRIDGDEIEVTHHEIALMLGIRRASVTDALHILEGEGLIRCIRGRVTIRDRAGLRRFAGEAYGVAEAEYSRLIAPFGKG